MRTGKTVHGRLVEALEDRVLMAFSTHINFQPVSTLRVDGYAVDRGLTFRTQGDLKYGWSTSRADTAVDRNRANSPDQRYDTFNVFADGGINARWEIEVPNGLYEVRVVAGDPVYIAGDIYRIKAEDTLVMSAKPSRAQPWVDRTILVPVSDGRLTLASLTTGVNSKICFADIQQVVYPGWILQAESASVASGVFNDGPAVTSLDTGDYLKFDSVYFGANRFKSVFARVAAGLDVHQSIEFRIDGAQGPLIAKLDMQATGPEAPFFTQHADVAEVSGTHDLYVVFNGAATTSALDYFRFNTKPLYKVMCLGDSITESRGGYASYRKYLSDLLMDADYDLVDFVGTHRGVVEVGVGPAVAWDYDQDHEGHSGFRIDDVLDGLDGSGTLTDWLGQNRPDLVIINLGINDLIVWEPVEEAIAEMGQVIDTLRAANPRMKIVLSLLAPTGPDRGQPGAREAFNAALATLRNQMHTSMSPIYLTDLSPGYDPTVGVDSFDGLHPNDQGERKFAARYFETLDEIFAENPPTTA